MQRVVCKLRLAESVSTAATTINIQIITNYATRAQSNERRGVVADKLIVMIEFQLLQDKSVASLVIRAVLSEIY